MKESDACWVLSKNLKGQAGLSSMLAMDHIILIELLTC